ncbi:hypothetical protein V9T40_011288 [Parthenolecanium corni]|uniref:Uncharacterized protein n=1 Tax=Parthenolecanium corni TaxID=536013 RepID=A0AAN9T530_9HEMI
MRAKKALPHVQNARDASAGMLGIAQPIQLYSLKDFAPKIRKRQRYCYMSLNDDLKEVIQRSKRPSLIPEPELRIHENLLSLINQRDYEANPK